MKWLTNDIDVTKKSDHVPMIGRNEENYWQWRNALIVGEPKATNEYTVEQLKAMGMIGLYGKD